MKLNNVFLIEKDTAKKEKNVNFSIHKKCVKTSLKMKFSSENTVEKDILENAGILNEAFAEEEKHADTCIMTKVEQKLVIDV